MKCTNCKFSFEEESRICPNCGTEIYFDEDSDYDYEESVVEDYGVKTINQNSYDINIDNSKVNIIDIFENNDELDEDEAISSVIDISEDTIDDSIINKDDNTDNKSNDIDNVEYDDDSLSDTIITNSNFEVFGPEDDRYNDVDVIKPEENSGVNINTSDNTSGLSKKHLAYIILLIVVIAVILFTITHITSSKNDSVVDDNSIVDKTIEYNKIVFNNKVFEISTDYDYIFSNDSIIVSKDGLSFRIEINNGKFKELISEIDELHIILKKKGFSCDKADKKTINGLEIITMEVKYEKQNGLILFADNGGSSYFTITVVNKDNNIDYGVLDDIINIIKTSKNYENKDIIEFNNIGKEFESISK